MFSLHKDEYSQTKRNLCKFTKICLFKNSQQKLFAVMDFCENT